MDFKTFLIKYTNINTKFIDDFYSVIKEDYIEHYNDFLIDSELLRKWLKITTHVEFKKTIKNSYRINIDYIIKKVKKDEGSGSGGHNKEIIILTPEATKKICLMTRSKLGDDIRQYFIDIELALYKFKNYIIEGLNKKIKELENNQKSKINSSKGIIYVFRALNTENATLYKIGKTISSKKRFCSHNSPLANDLEIIMTYEADNIEQLEQCVKLMMKKAQYRKYKEIYQVDLNIIKKIIKDCDIKLNEINDIIDEKNNKQKGGNSQKNISLNDKLFLLIPND
jgi:phage anti-repressor protein